MTLSSTHTGRMTPPIAGPAAPTVLVVAARSDGRGLAGARQAAELLREGGAVVVAHGRDPELPALLGAADRVVVLDPGRITVALARLRRTTGPDRGVPGLPARTGDRLALLALTRAHADRVQWVCSAAQWRSTCRTVGGTAR
jgi:NAD(P)-dependent dehydrogenase (short-subunit alcohol dehydrogenase family)